MLKGYFAKLIISAYDFENICAKSNINRVFAIRSILNPGNSVTVSNRIIYSIGLITSMYGIHAGILSDLFIQYCIKSIQDGIVILGKINK